MTPYIAAYIGALVAFLIIDGIWLGLVATDSYKSAIGHLMREQPQILPAATFYLMYCAVVVYFAIAPNMHKGWQAVAVSGAVLGFVAYGTYNMTNYSILKDWPLGITIKDWVWGTLVTSTTSVAGFYALKLIK